MTATRFTLIVPSLVITLLAFGCSQESKIGTNPSSAPKPTVANGESTKDSGYVKPDAERIQGAWQAVNIGGGGKQNPEDPSKLKMLFQEKEFVVDFGKSAASSLGTYTLHADSKPKSIEMKSSSTNINRAQEPFWGIYRFEKDRLVICMAPRDEPRPTEFQSKQGSKSVLFTLKRGTSAEEKKLSMMLATAKKELADAQKMHPYHAKQVPAIKNLWAIGSALHAYHVDKEELPTQIADKNGKLLLSWRVAVLPYLESKALYKEFKLDEPWNSEHNMKLLSKMPKVFRCPHRDTKETPSSTYFVGFKGPGGVLGGPKGVSLSFIASINGTGKTVVVAEGREPVPWTKPADLEFALDKPLPPLGDPRSKEMLALFADVHFKRIPIDSKQIKLMIRWNNETPFQLQ